MKQVYSPANLAEAHMLAHLLQQNDIIAHIHGEALQGGVGELPAENLLQLLVTDEDYDRARTLILTWERTSAAPGDLAPKKPTIPLVAGLIIFVLGAGGGWALRTAASANAIPIDMMEDGIDLNGDDRDDLTYFYRIGAPYAHKAEGDRNFDGAIDYSERYNAEGIIATRASDDNFDGFVETRTRFEAGNATNTDIETHGRRIARVRQFYIDGVLRREELHDASTGRLVRVNFYTNLQLERAEVDVDRDGFLETIRSFDQFGEITNTQTRAPS